MLFVKEMVMRNCKSYAGEQRVGPPQELELVDSMDPYSEGVVFCVRPPKESWKCIANLSGRNKDLDNMSIAGHCIKDRTKDAQFIIKNWKNTNLLSVVTPSNIALPLQPQEQYV